MGACPLRPLIFILAMMASAHYGCSSMIAESSHEDPDKFAVACDSIGNLISSCTETRLAFSDLEKLFESRLDKETVPFISSEIRQILSKPLDIRALISSTTFTEAGVEFPAGIEGRLSSIIAQFMKTHYHCNFFSGFPPQAEQSLDLITYLDLIISIMEEAGVHIENAFSALSKGERGYIAASSLSFLHDFTSADRIGDDAFTSFVSLASRVNLIEMAKAFKSLGWLFSREHITLLKALSSKAHDYRKEESKDRFFRGEILLMKQSSIGLMVIGGFGSNVYLEDAAVIIDLGGDDTYLNNAGSSPYERKGSGIGRITSPVSIIIDVEGNDSYLSTRHGSMGSGFMGIGVLMDLDGDDFYSGSILSQGSGFLGIGSLIDLKGNDLYSAQEISQGAGLFGGGILIDGTGDDKYSGAKYIQGFGGPGGRGILLDVSGNDLYRAGVKYASTYGTSEVYHTVAQGAGWGLRGKAAGGVGILQDKAGNDIYIAGNFSQGTGYYLGLGVLMDDAGNDRYIGSRYCQGSAAHLAAGIILDRKGSDSYSARIAASQGGAWDLSFACALDLEGDDKYQAGDLALGAGAQNGIGLFYDGYGKDHYRANPMGLGYGGDLTYEEGRQAANIGIFLDTGGCNDIYDIKDLADNLRLKRGEQGIFVDE